MLIIQVKEGENIDRALKRYKRKYERTGVIKEIRFRQQFDRPSAIKRKNKLKAIYTDKVRREKEGI